MEKQAIRTIRTLLPTTGKISTTQITSAVDTVLKYIPVYKGLGRNVLLAVCYTQFLHLVNFDL